MAQRSMSMWRTAAVIVAVLGVAAQQLHHVSAQSQGSAVADCRGAFNSALASSASAQDRCVALEALETCSDGLATQDEKDELQPFVEQARLIISCDGVTTDHATIEVLNNDLVLTVPQGHVVRVSDGTSPAFTLQELHSTLQSVSETQQEIQSKQTNLETEIGNVKTQLTEMEASIRGDIKQVTDALRDDLNKVILALAANTAQQPNVAVDNLITVSDVSSGLGSLASTVTAAIDATSGTLTQRINTLENDASTMTSRVKTIAETLYAGSAGTTDVDAMLANTYDLSQVGKNMQSISSVASDLGGLTTDVDDIEDRVEAVETAIGTLAKKTDIRSDDSIRSVVGDMVDNKPANNKLSSALGQLAQREEDVPDVVQVFRYNSGSFSLTGAAWRDMTGTNAFGYGEAMHGQFYLPTKTRVHANIHIGGDYVDGGGRTLHFRAVCTQGSTTRYIPDDEGFRIYKYEQHNRLESENFQGTSDQDMDAGWWTCKLQANPGSNSPYSWSAAYGDISMLAYNALPFNPSDASMLSPMPQQLFRQTTGSRDYSANGWYPLATTAGYVNVAKDNMGMPYYVHVGGDWVNDCGRTVHYRVVCTSGHSDTPVYLPDTGGFSAYKYVTENRLESETFSSVTNQLSRGRWRCGLQVYTGSSCRYHWSASYGELSIVMGDNQDPQVVPQQVFRLDSGSVSTTNSNWFNYPNARGTFTQAIDDRPLRYVFHVGGDWVDASDRYVYYRLVCSSGGTTIYIPDGAGHRVYKYINNNRLESETMVGVFSPKKGDWTCQAQGRSHISAPTFSWSSGYGEVTFSVA